MNNDPTTRSARRIATLIAVPIALVVGFVAFQVLKPAPEPVTTPRVQSSTPVEMPARTLDERQTTVCRALLSQLPTEIRDAKQRPVTAGPEQNAAFGDPAITVACGTPPSTVALTDKVFALNSVCWHADPTSTRWTTVDREVPITVTVPEKYQPAFQWVLLFSNPIASTVPSTDGPVPTGCKGY